MPYILRFLVATMYGIRVALGHKSRTFGYPDPTLHVPTNPTAWTVSTTSRGQFRSTEVAERSPGTPQARWRWTTPVRPREASIVQHSCLHADPTIIVAPRLHRGAHNRGSRFVERPQLTIYGRHTSEDVDRRGIRMSRWSWSPSCECALDTAFVRVMTV